MASILNITNGDCAVAVMEKADIPGKYLAWRDVLHDGPVPSGLTLEALSEVRAGFIVSRGWGEAEFIEREFGERDSMLKSYNEYDKVVLWFEHDLYDQLQLLQILDWFHDHPAQNTELSLICTDNYLGPLSPAEMVDLTAYEVPITAAHTSLARKAWAAFRSSTPEAWFALQETDTTMLPYLEGAIVRMLEEYPCVQNGLSRTEQQALMVLSSGDANPTQIFSRNQEMEDRVFLGDSSFWVILERFMSASPAVIKSSDGGNQIIRQAKDQMLTITEVGIAILAAKLNWVDLESIDRWIGGVHLNQGNGWRWNDQLKTMVQVL